MRATSRFEVRRRIGAGGMGVVYEAFDRDRNQLVALKTLKHCDPQALLQFKREFRMLQDIEHPNLVSLGELFEVDQHWFFSMEFVAGVDLRTYIRAGRGVAFLPTTDVADERSLACPAPDRVSFDEARLRRAMAGLAAGIAAVHEAGKVHRDIKPSNVLVTAADRVVLLDFGLVTHAATERRSTGELIAGTAAYMAPEQAAVRTLGPAADWYSLGVVLYEVLTGRLPHNGDNSLEILWNKQHDVPPSPRAWNPDAPADLAQLCTDLLATLPGDRPSGDEVCARLGVRDAQPRRRAQRSTDRSFHESTPFVGRVRELALLSRRFRATRTRPEVVVIEGESGLGKTRLVEHFTEQLRAEHPGVVVLAGRCYERESVPYKAVDGIADALSRYMAHLAPADAAVLLPTEAGQLPRLFQAFERVEAIAHAPYEPELDDLHEQRRRMFDALRELFVRLTKRRQVVLVIDDLQWTDPDSIHLLWSLLSHAEAPPLLVLATSRPVEQAGRARELARLYELTDATRISLGELSQAHAQHLLRSLLPEARSSAASQLARESGGHPLFVHELARVASGPERQGKASLDDMLWSRIKALPRDSRHVLQAVCVAGRPTSQQTMANAVCVEFAELSKLVALLRAAQLVRTNGVRRTDSLVCYHDRIRELVVRKLEPEQLRRWHARLAVALERAGAAKSDPNALVEHAEAAGDPQRAARYARAAGCHAMDASAFDKAAEFFAVVMRLARFERADDRRAAQLQLAHALSSAGRGPEAAALFEAAAVGADAATRMECQRRAAEQWLVTGHIGRGLESVSVSLSEIGETLHETPRRALVSLLCSRFRLRIGGLGWTEREEGQVALATLNRLDVLKTVAHNLATVDNIRGADYNARFLRLALATGEPTRIVFAMATEAAFIASQGRRSRKRVQRLVNEVRRIAHSQPDNPLLAAWAGATEGWVGHMQGEFKRANEALRKSGELLRGLAGTTFEQNNCYLWRVYALCQLGDLNELRAHYPRYLRDAQERGDRFVETTLRRAAGRFLFLSADDPAGARRDLRRATWEPPEGTFHIQHWFELESECEIALYEGTSADPDSQFEAQFALLERSMLTRVQVVRARVMWAKARLALAAGDAGIERARKLARKLRRERIGYTSVMCALVNAAVASHDERRGRARAIAHLRAAIALASDADMALHRATAQRRLAALVDGSESDVLRAESDAWMRDQGVVDPARLAGVVAPGFRVE